MRKARLLVAPPAERVEYFGGDGKQSQAGDIVQLDHGFTFPDGRPGGLVYCEEKDYEAEVYDSEIELMDEVW